MATIKAIDAKSVHQIQSGQVIVDLCSVVKELVENSLDAGATAIEVRFKNHGLDAIEVQDNGCGISAQNYESIALKHHTSKLSSYDDLAGLQSFGFRGEALSSMCALSKFSMATAQEDEAPKGHRLTFAMSGELDNTSVIACQKGTTAIVEELFHNLPVRRKELTKNIKREYGKVLGLLHAYACICVNVKLSVKNAMQKGKSMVVFATQGNVTTRENIANVYGAKALSALVPLDLNLELQPDLSQTIHSNSKPTRVRLLGHISRPVFGEGRQAPDRQMFFVNGRPCGLPQIAKAINEVYKSFNVSQSPFIFADFHMDTDSYDVNVSPDKRTILLHNVTSLVENLKTELTAMFDEHEQTVPQSQAVQASRGGQRPFKLPRFTSRGSQDDEKAQELADEVQTRAENQDEKIDEPEADSVVETPWSRIIHANLQTDSMTAKASVPDRSDWERMSIERQEKRAMQIVEKLQPELDFDELEVEVEQHRPRRDEEEDEDGDAWSDGRLISSSRLNGRTVEAQERRSVDQSESEDTPMDRSRRTSPISKVTKIAIGEPLSTSSQSPFIDSTSFTSGNKMDTGMISSQSPHSPLTSRTKHQMVGKYKLGALATSPAASQFSRKLQKFGAAALQDDTGEVSSSDEEDGNGHDGLGSPGQLAEQFSTPADGETDEKDGNEVGSDDVPDGTQQASSQSDSECIDERDQKAKEAARVAELIRAAEDTASTISDKSMRRANNVLKPIQGRESTVNLLTNVDVSVTTLSRQCAELQRNNAISNDESSFLTDTQEEVSAESKLDLTVSKKDFADMDIVGQFNLGFILAVRSSPKAHDPTEHNTRTKDELFIIDQHASDEKYNFERLQNGTVVGTQRLVRPGILDLTAVEEEIVLEHTDALQKNGFIVEIDTSGNSPVGRRCKLVSLPLSKEVVFNALDLEELIHLLSDAPSSTSSTISSVPRPSKVRKMFAMRACRSSIMIGKTLSHKQMSTVVKHMGVIDKPWNCPHGRPTMRHLTSLDALTVWKEGDGIAGGYLHQPLTDSVSTAQAWRDYIG